MNPLRMTPETIRLGGHRGHSAGAPKTRSRRFGRRLNSADVTSHAKPISELPAMENLC